MGGPLGKYPIALLSCAPTPWRLVALCALALGLIPTSLAQDSQPIIPTFFPSDGWHGLMSMGSSNNYYVKFSVNPNAWNKLIILAGIVTKPGLSGEASLALFEGSEPVPVLTFGMQEGGVPYDIPEGENHNYTYTIKATPGSPDSMISVYKIFVSGARSSNAQIGLPIPASTLPGTQTFSTPSNVSSTAIAAIATSSTSVISTTQLTSLITASPTIPTGLLSPPAFTNSPNSVSDASLVSSGSGTPGPNSSAIIGAVFGILVGITLCVFAGLLYLRRRVRNRVAPSTAFMNYRSTTKQPPAYPFNRSSFFQRSKAGLAGFGGLGDSKVASPHPFSSGVAVAGLGYGAAAGAGGGTLDEKSAEGRELPMTASAIAPPYEYPHRPVVPYQGQGGMGVGGGDIGGGSLGGAGAGSYEPTASRSPSIDVARTLTPPLSAKSNKFASTPSFMDGNLYNELAMPEPVVNSHADPFRTPPVDDNTAGRGVWGRA